MIAITKPKKHVRSQGIIVREIILDSERFYKPVRRYRKEFTSTGTKINYPGTVDSKSKKSGRFKSFLWDSDWRANIRSTRSSNSSQPITPCEDIDELPVFDEDIISTNEIKNLRRINTIGARRGEIVKFENPSFPKCTDYESSKDYLLTRNTANSSKFQFVDDFIKNEIFNSSMIYDRIYNQENTTFEDKMYEDNDTFLITRSSKPDSINELIDSQESLDLENSICTIRKLHYQIEKLADDLTQTFPKSKNLDPNVDFILAERSFCYEPNIHFSSPYYSTLSKCNRENEIYSKVTKTLPNYSSRQSMERDYVTDKLNSNFEDSYERSLDANLGSLDISNVLSAERSSSPIFPPPAIENLSSKTHTRSVSNTVGMCITRKSSRSSTK